MQSAADVFTNVDSLQLPTVEDETTGSASALGRRAEELREEAQMAEKNALDERTNNEPVVRDADVEYLEAKHALEQVLAMQQQADAIMADLDAARARAVEARTAAEQTLTDANNTLNTLIGFDKLVADSRDAALAALANVPAVEAELAEADGQTDAAERALGNAHADAADGERIAADAQKQAEDASKQATQMRQRAAATKDSAKNMKAEADELKTSVASELETIENYATQAGKDKQTATEVRFFQLIFINTFS
jgi:coxsackievirus/adenovirus receptor